MVAVVEHAKRFLAAGGDFRHEVEVFGKAIVAHTGNIRRESGG